MNQIRKAFVSALMFSTLSVSLWPSVHAQPRRPMVPADILRVANVGDDMIFGIELGAPRDGGAMVTFVACPFTAEYPEQREGQPPSTKIKIDNVNRELVPQIRAALGTRQYIQILYREYLGSDLTEPAYGPIEFELRDVQMVGASLTGAAMVRNLQNKRFPRLNKNYDYVQFPSLLP